MSNNARTAFSLALLGVSGAILARVSASAWSAAMTQDPTSRGQSTTARASASVPRAPRTPRAAASVAQSSSDAPELGYDASQQLELEGDDHVNTFSWRGFDGRSLRTTVRIKKEDARRSEEDWGTPLDFQQRITDATNADFRRAFDDYNLLIHRRVDERNRAAEDAFDAYKALDASAVDECNAVLNDPNRSSGEHATALARLEEVRRDANARFDATIAGLDEALARNQREDETAYNATLAEVEARHAREIARTLESACLVVIDDYLCVDPACVVAREVPRTASASQQLFSDLRASYGTLESVQDAALAMVATALGYRVPPDEAAARSTYGVLPPAACLARGWGDCDSKAMLLAALFRGWPAPDTGRGGCIGVLIPEHFLLGVQRTPVSGQFYVEFEGLPYVLMETAGPGVVPAGVVGDSTKAYIDGGGKFSLRRIY